MAIMPELAEELSLALSFELSFVSFFYYMQWEKRELHCVVSVPTMKIWDKKKRIS